MDKTIYLNQLYDYYSELFTEKQKHYFEDYYFKDLSLAEIAENYQVSRNAVHGQLKIVEEKLEEYESILKLSKKGKEIKKLLSKIEDRGLAEEIEKLI